MDTQLLMNTAMLAGEIMLCSGAETYRVEDTMHHILKTAEHLEIAQILVIMTGISATLKIKEEEMITSIRRVEAHHTNLRRVVDVNAISRRYCGGEITLEQAYEELLLLKDKEYGRRAHGVALVGICAGFALFFGGNIWDLVAAFCVGGFLAVCDSAGEEIGFNALIQDIFVAMGVAIATILLKAMLGERMNMDTVMIASIMPLVPGVAITNAVRDTLKGDYLSGTARVLEAFLKAACIAIGIALGFAVFGGVLKGGWS